MTEPAAPQGATSTLPRPAPSGTTQSALAPHATGRGQTRTPTSGMRTALIASLAALIVAVIFIIQNVHAANISFLGIHLVLPQAGALLLAGIAGSLLTVAAGPARISQLRQLILRGLRKARGGQASHPTASTDHRYPAHVSD
jgi:uncharacterized integral membrane protein